IVGVGGVGWCEPVAGCGHPPRYGRRRLIVDQNGMQETIQSRLADCPLSITEAGVGARDDCSPSGGTIPRPRAQSTLKVALRGAPGVGQGVPGKTQSVGKPCLDTSRCAPIQCEMDSALLLDEVIALIQVIETDGISVHVIRLRRSTENRDEVGS